MLHHKIHGVRVGGIRDAEAAVLQIRAEQIAAVPQALKVALVIIPDLKLQHVGDHFLDLIQIGLFPVVILHIIPEAEGADGADGSGKLSGPEEALVHIGRTQAVRRIVQQLIQRTQQHSSVLRQVVLLRAELERLKLCHHAVVIQIVERLLEIVGVHHACGIGRLDGGSDGIALGGLLILGVGRPDLILGGIRYGQNTALGAHRRLYGLLRPAGGENTAEEARQQAQDQENAA